MIKKCLVLAISVSIGSLSHAADLMDIYHQALENDPQFKAAYSTFLSKSEAIPQAQSALLPQVGMSGQSGFNTLKIKTGLIEGSQPYYNQQLVLNASQAIFNLQAWDSINQAKASVKSAHATFNDAAQNLILRAAQAYLTVLLSRDTLSYTEAKKRANKRQLDEATERFNVGVDSITSVYEAKAAYDQSISQVIAAKNNQIDQNENLRKLTNVVYDYLSPLRNGNVPLIKPEPNNVDDWVAAGLKQNYLLFSAKYNLQAARENIKVQSTKNWPTFGIQGTGSKVNNTGNGNFFVPSAQVGSSVALTMNFPAFQGGLIESLTRQAQYDFQTSSELLEQTYRGVIVNSRIAFNTIVDGISKVKADRQTIISQQKSLESTEAQYQVGTRTMLDVTNVQTLLFQAQMQLATDQYNYIISILNLKYLAGSLNVADIEEVNSWMDTTRINGLPQKFLAKTAKH